MALKRVSTTESSQSKKKMRMELNDDSKKPQLGLGFLGTKRVILLPPTDIIAGDCYRTPSPLLRSLDYSVPLTTTTTRRKTWEATIKNPSFSGGEDEEFSDADSESTAVRRAPVLGWEATATTPTTIKKPSLLLGGEEDEESPALLKALAEEIKMEMKMMELEGHLRSMEAEPMMRPHHIMTRKGVFVRAIAINRMAQVAQRCCSRPEEILPLSVSYFDSDALFLHYLCPVATDNKYTAEDVIKVESKVLDALNFQLGEPTAKTFLDGFIFSAASASHLDSNDNDNDNDDELLLHLETLANYLVHLSLLEYNCVQFLPSLIAASAVFLARFTIHPNKRPWCPVMEHRTGYTAPELKECVRIMHNLQLCRTDLRQFTALAHKYETVAIWFATPSEIPEAYLQQRGGDWGR